MALSNANSQEPILEMAYDWAFTNSDFEQRHPDYRPEWYRLAQQLIRGVETDPTKKEE